MLRQQYFDPVRLTHSYVELNFSCSYCLEKRSKNFIKLDKNNKYVCHYEKYILKNAIKLQKLFCANRMFYVSIDKL